MDDRHLEHLGFKDNTQGYLEWCKCNGFKASLDKGWPEMRKEQRFFNSQKAIAVLKKKKLKTVKQAVDMMRKGAELKEFEGKSVYYAICHTHDKLHFNDEWLDFIQYLDKVSKVIDTPERINALHHVFDQRYQWIRPVNEWIPKTHNREKQFSNLVRYLFCKYDVPLFMDKCWYNGVKPHQEWFTHIGNGGNIRTVRDLPIPMTKKMAHHFLTAPADYTIVEAFRWGQILALGGDKRLVEAFRPCNQFIGFDEGRNDFCLSVMRFFIDNPMFDIVNVGPIVDYIWEKKYTQRRVFVARGQVEFLDPEQPNFSMTGRTPESLLNQVNRWHRQLGKEKKGGNLQWEHSKHKDFEVKEGKEGRNLRYWKIKELLSTAELKAEGRAMRNCVASYAHSCFHGSCSIWSLQVEDWSGTHNRGTIEVRYREIRQARASRNEWLPKHEFGIMSRWARREGIEISKWVRSI